MADSQLPVIDKKTTLAELKEIVKGIVGGDEMIDILRMSTVTPMNFQGAEGHVESMLAYRLGIIRGLAMRTIGAHFGELDFKREGVSLGNKTKKGKKTNEQEG